MMNIVPPEGWPWGHWGGDCVCKGFVLLASSLLPVHMLGALCDTAGNLKQSVPWGRFEEIFPHWALLQDQPGLIRIRSGLVWEAQDCLLHDWPAFKLCFYVSFGLHGGDVLARVLLQRSVSLVLRHFEVLSSLLKGTLAFIWSNAALLPYSLSTHGVASLWKQKKIDHCLLQLGFYKIPMGIKHTIPSGSF